MTTTAFYRLYWLGVATEPGIWAIDRGAGTKIWRVHSWECSGLVRAANLPAPVLPGTPRPSGWMMIYPETFIRVEAPQGTFQNTALNGSFSRRFEQAYESHAVAAF